MKTEFSQFKCGVAKYVKEIYNAERLFNSFLHGGQYGGK